MNAYLTDSIGPGATAVDNLLAQNSFPIGLGQDGEYEVISYPRLEPGDYYLMLIDFGPNRVGWDSISLQNLTISAIDGVSLMSSLGYSQQSGSFPPAYTPNGDTRDASLFAGMFAFRLEATAVPEPGSCLLMLLVSTGLALSHRRQRI